MLGIDVLEGMNFSPLAKKRGGLLTHPAGVNRNGRSTVDVLHRAKNVNLVALFGPEHGIYGDEKADVPVLDRIDRRTKLPLGTLANGDLRHKRIHAHHALHSVQAQLGMSRDQSYRWLQTQMGLPGDQVHIAKCGDYRCEQIIRICENATAW